MFCPKCLAEYRTGFTRCSDCDVALVAMTKGPLPSFEHGLPVMISRPGLEIVVGQDSVLVHPTGLKRLFTQDRTVRRGAFSHVEVAWWTTLETDNSPKYDWLAIRLKVPGSRDDHLTLGEASLQGHAGEPFNGGPDVTVVEIGWYSEKTDEQILPYRIFLDGLAKSLDLPVAVNALFRKDADSEFDDQMARIFHGLPGSEHAEGLTIKLQECGQCGEPWNPQDYRPDATSIFCVRCRTELVRPTLSPGGEDDIGVQDELPAEKSGMESHTEFVVVGTYQNDWDAHVAKAALEAAGIKSTVNNTIGGALPRLAFSHGIELLVESEHAQEAAAILGLC